MVYFDNINFLNLEWLFNQVFKIFFKLPEYLLFVLFFWTDTVTSFWIKVLLWIVSVFFAGIIFYSIYKIWEVNQKDMDKYLALFIVENKAKEEKRIINQEWVDILGHLESMNPPSWVMAVMEADKLLDMLLTEKGFIGANIGEKLKSTSQDKLKSIQDAWEAHKIRNRIAHESGYVLEKREARKAISHYEIVFRELGFVE